MKLYKLQIYVPKSHAKQVQKALGDAGAGQIGNYSHCAFVTEGRGYFLPLSGSDPFIGEEGKLEEVEECKIETICEEERLEKVLNAVREAHPYEEPMVDFWEVQTL